MISQPEQVRFIAALLREVEFLRQTIALYKHLQYPAEYIQDWEAYANANELGACWLAERTPEEFTKWYAVEIEGYSVEEVDWMFANRIEVAA